MKAGKNLLASSPSIPPRAHLKNCPSSSVSMLSEQAAHAPAFMPTASLALNFPTSVLLQEQRDESKQHLSKMKDEKPSQVTLDGMRMESGLSEDEKNNDTDSDQHIKDFQRQMHNWSGIWYLLPPVQSVELPSLTMLSAPSKTNKPIEVETHSVVSVAKKAWSASKQAALLAKDSELCGADVDESLIPISRSTSFTTFPPEGEKIVRSTRILERQSKKRRVPKPKVMVQETRNPRKTDLRRKVTESFDTNDPLRLFLQGTETRTLVTAKEESELILHIQDLMRIEEVKSTLQSQFNREPTLVEWAAAIGLSCRDLKLQLHYGNSSRKKLICANFRLVVHIAKQYQGRGLNLQDLLQEGSIGLMRSVEKFKPQAGCRLATYAYWWIRQAIGKAIFQHSRTIRLPDNVYGLLSKAKEAKRLCIQEGNHQPTKEEIAARVGITVEKLERLLFAARMPLSIQQPVWTDNDTTFQEITADTAVESPDVSVGKQLMRQHIRNLLNILSPKERKIMRLRYGIKGSKPRTLSEIGAIIGLSRERVRQLERRSLCKLKQSLNIQGLGAYADLLI